MAELMERVAHQRAKPDIDLAGAIGQILHASDEPLTLAKIRAALPASFRGLTAEAVADMLERQLAAQVFVLYPKYRGAQDRFWDRPMRVHLEWLLRGVLGQGPLTWSEIRKRLPDYAKVQSESVLEELVAHGKLHRHPPAGRRAGPRFGLEAADPHPYVLPELNALFTRCERLGFGRAGVRAALLDLLRQEEWATCGFTGPGRPEETLLPRRVSFAARGFSAIRY